MSKKKLSKKQQLKKLSSTEKFLSIFCFFSGLGALFMFSSALGVSLAEKKIDDIKWILLVLAIILYTLYKIFSDKLDDVKWEKSQLTTTKRKVSKARKKGKKDENNNSSF